MKKNKKISLVLATSSSLLIGSVVPALTSTSCSTNQITINWVNWDGALLLTQKVEKGTKPEYKGKTPFRPDFEGTHYTFASWSPEIVPADKDVTYKATFTKTDVLYTIRFVNWNGEPLQERSYYWGEDVVYDGIPPTRPDDEDGTIYDFIGWDEPIVKACADKEYKAQFNETKNATHVKFNVNGKIVQDTGVPYGEVPSFEGSCVAPKYANGKIQTFTGWSPKLVPVPDGQKEPITYTAQYSVETDITDTIINFSLEIASDPTISFSVENNGKPWTVIWDCDGEAIEETFEADKKEATHTFEGSDQSMQIKILGNQYITSVSFDTPRSDNNVTIESIELSNTITEIKNNAFNSTSISSFTFPPSVCKVGKRIFSKGKHFKEIHMPPYFRKIDGLLLSGMSQLNKLELGGTQEIEDDAFVGCNIRSITIPETLTKLSSRSFFSCGEVDSIIVSPNNPVYYSNNVGTETNAIIEIKTGTIIKGCKSSTITSSVRNIGDFAFYESGFEGSLENSSIENIGNSAFAYCYGAELPEKELYTVTMPQTLKSIGQTAFMGCSNNLVVDLSKTSKERIVKGGTYMFGSVIPFVPLLNLVIYIPKGSFDKYNVDEKWQEYALHLVEKGE